MLKPTPQFLKTQGNQIVDQDKKPVSLKGVNLGGWLLMEAYFMHAPNRPEQTFKQEFVELLGKKSLIEFEREFRKNFISKKDFQNISKLGFNCIRLPFNFRLIENEKSPGHYKKAGLEYLDQAIDWAKKNHLWVILDLHAAAGSQNHDWHSDSLGQAELWLNRDFQKQTCALWEFLADRYKDEPTIAGYDLLNEAVLEDTKLLNKFYREVIKAIRRVDRNHILFVEGNRWAMDIACLDHFDDPNVVLSVHAYQPLDFTFNFVPHLHYPLRNHKSVYAKKELRYSLKDYAELGKKLGRPIFVGEFGINSRQGLYGEGTWLKDILACFDELGFHWTYWTYKAVKNNFFPDGIYSYFPNSPWVNRQGPQTGWDTYRHLWPKHKKDMIESWKTENFTANTFILDILKDAVSS